MSQKRRDPADPQPAADDRWGSGVAWVDYDRDGKLDLVVGNYCKWTPKTDVFCSVYRNKKSYCTPSVFISEAL